MTQLLKSRVASVMVAMAAVGLMSSAAKAAFVSESSGSALTYSNEYVATSGTTYSSASGNDYSLMVAGQYSFTRSFGAPQTNVLGTSSIGNYAFQDSYVFQVGAAASGDVLTASLSLPGTFALSNVQFRLYQITSGTTAPVVGGSLTGNPSVVSVLTKWKGQSGVDNTAISASFSGMQSTGTYVLDIAGTATGSSGGLYVGSLNLQAVPLPAAVWFMLSGLAGLGVMARKRKISDVVCFARSAHS
jgi:hypothetical protein